MGLQGVRLVTFDATNTLLKFRVSPWIHYTNVARQYGYKGTEQQVHLRFYENYKLVWKYYPNFGSDTIGWRAWWTHVIKRTFREHYELVGSLDKLSEHLIEDFKTSKCWTQADSASKLITNLKDRNISVGIISNFDPRLHNVLDEVGFDRKNFEFVLTSYAAKLMKPNPEIFDLALKECERLDFKGELRSKDITAVEAMHIGDDYENDYCAARNAGWKSAIILNDKPLPQSIEDGSVFKSLAHFNNFLIAKDIKPSSVFPVLDPINVTPPPTDANNNIDANLAQQTTKANTEDAAGTEIAPKMNQDYSSKMQSDNNPKLTHNCMVANQESLNTMQMRPNEASYEFPTNYTGSQYGMEGYSMEISDTSPQQEMAPNYSPDQQQLTYGYNNTISNQEEMPQNYSPPYNNQYDPGYQWCPNPGNPNQQFNTPQGYSNQGDSNQKPNSGYPCNSHYTNK